MAYAVWLAPFGWGIFMTGLIAAIIIFAVKRKFYPVMYLVSIATYIFTVGFVIDAFDFKKDGTLLMLAFSSGVFILAGFYFTKRFSKKKEQFMRSIPDRRGRIR